MIEDSVSWGSLLNLAALVISMIGLAAKVSKSYADLRLKIEEYHSENRQKIALLERDVQTIRGSLNCTKIGCPLRESK